MTVLDSSTEPTKQFGGRFHLDHGRLHLDRDTSARLALIVFLAAEAAMFITVLIVGRHQWFTDDEWDFLQFRNAGSITSLFTPHAGQWSTLPILAYRALFNLVGLRAYWPYLAVVVLLHLIAAALLRIVMRRAKVGPWIATIVASVFVLFGAGYQDLLWAFQMGFVGSLVFGLTQLLLADHDGPIDRRDWLGLLAGLAGLMCSNVAVAMTIAVGLAALIRRGWRPALFQTGPLAAVWLIWYFGIDRPNYSFTPLPITFSHHLSLTLRWFTTGVRAFFEAMGQYAGVGVALAVLLVVGLVLAWSRLDRQELRTQAAAPAALLVTAFVFVFTTGWERDVNHSVQYATESRYLHIFAAMALPAMAVAASALVSRWRILIPAVLGLLVVGIPGNLQTLAAPPGGWSASAQTLERQHVLSLVTVPAAREVPRSAWTFACAPPCTFVNPEVLTIGWLLDQKAAGRLPKPGPVSPTTRADATLQLALQEQSKNRFGSGASGDAAVVGPTPSNPASTLVNVANNPKLGPILVDNKGMTLYTLTKGYTPITCSSACGSTWPSLLVPPGTTTLTGGPGVAGLGKSGSGTVVEYKGYPLAHYSGDKAPGETKGNGRKSDGGTWHTLGVTPVKACSSLTAPVTRTLQKGQSILIKQGNLGVIYQGAQGTSDINLFVPDTPTVTGSSFSPAGRTLVAEVSGLKVELLPAGGTVICM